MSKKKLIFILVPILLIFVVSIIVLCTSFGSIKGYSGKVTAQGIPLADVSVSDGRNVVKTDENGMFELKGYRKTRFIMVTPPAGYTTENYYIKAEKNKSDNYNFDLQESAIKAGEAHNFLQISDTEIGENGVGEWVNYIKDTADKNKSAFIIHTGDICYEPGLKQHIKGMNTENMGVPVRYIIGNHDYVDGKYGEELFESIYGPVWYSFEVGNVHYIVTPFQSGADKKSGYNKNDRWRWLENDLANTDENMKVVMFNHTLPPSDDYVISFDRKKLDLKKHNLIAWIFGHYHYNYIEENDGVLNISTARPDCGGIDSSVSGARTIYIDQNGSVTTQMTYYDYNKTNQPKKAKWTAKVDGNVLFCDTIAENNCIYIASVDEDYPSSCGIYCLDSKTGKKLWSYKTKNSVKNNVIVQDKKLIAQDCEGNVYCLDAEKGTQLWTNKVQLGSSLNTSTGICVDDDLIYTGCAAAITALDIHDGKVVWENIRNHGEASPAEFIVHKDKLIVSSHWDSLTALDKKTGKMLWENKDEDIRFRSSTPCSVDDKSLLVADSDAIMIVDVETGEITNKKEVEGYNFSSSGKPLIDGDTAIIPTANKGVVGYDLKLNDILWTFAVGQAKIYTAPYTSGDSQTVESSIIKSADGSIIFAASDGKVYKISPQGKLIKSVEIGAPVFSTPVISGDDIIVSDFSGRVTCINKF